MTANINFYTGRQAAWHSLGIVAGKYQTSTELLAYEGFQYDVFKSQLRDGLGRPVEAYGTFRWNHADKLAGNKDAAIFLAPVGKDYTIIHHAESFKTIDAILQSVDGAHYETAGVLGNGEKVWALADINLSYSIGDDKHDSYLLAVESYDGLMSHLLKQTDVRVVCQNTLSLALSRASVASFSVRHTRNAMRRIDSIRDTMASLANDVKSVQERMLFLAGRKLTKESYLTVLDRLFPPTKDDDGKAKDTTRRNNILADVTRIFESNDGNAFPEQRGSAYNLLNAVTNYVDHSRAAKDDNRALSAMFGSGDTLKSRALTTLLEVSQDLPVLVGAPTGGSLDRTQVETDELNRMFGL